MRMADKDLRKKSESWAALTVVVRSLGKRVSTDLVARDF